MYTQFRTFIDNYVSLNAIEWSIVTLQLKIEHYKKGEVIHHMGDTVGALRFINRGLARSYVIDEKGKDYTWCIYFNDKYADMTNLFVIDYHSFINQEPSSMEIEILEDCEVVIIEYDCLKILYSKLKKVERLGRFMGEEAYSYLHKQTIDRQTKSAQERFDDFMKKTPYLLEKVPQYHIASYLNITRQHLSRLKRFRSSV